MRYLVLLAILWVPLCTAASGQSPYAGEEVRHIKSLSAQEIESLRHGNGMGFAKLAELNHYPGPKHVLEIADELALTTPQLEQTKALFEAMREQAVIIGEQLIAAEARLDMQFRRGTIDQESLEASLQEIGEIRARLRYVHLEAHLRQRALLQPEQIKRYDELRGYHEGTHRHSH